MTAEKHTIQNMNWNILATLFSEDGVILRLDLAYNQILMLVRTIWYFFSFIRFACKNTAFQYFEHTLSADTTQSKLMKKSCQ